MPTQEVDTDAIIKKYGGTIEQPKAASKPADVDSIIKKYGGTVQEAKPAAKPQEIPKPAVQTKTDRLIEKHGGTVELPPLTEETEQPQEQTPKKSKMERFHQLLSNIPSPWSPGSVADITDHITAIAKKTHELYSNPIMMTNEQWDSFKKKQQDVIDNHLQQFLEAGSGIIPGFDVAANIAGTKVGKGAIGGLAEFGEEFTSPYQVALMVGTLGESALARVAAATGIKGAVPVARTVAKLVQAEFIAGMEQGFSEGAVQTYQSVKDGDWQSASKAAVGSLASIVMAGGLASHEAATDRVRMDLEKTAREKYGKPDVGPMGQPFVSRFDQLDPYRQAAVIHETVRNSPEYSNALNGVEAKNEKAKAAAEKKNQKKLAEYTQNALNQTWSPKAATRAFRKIDEHRHKSEVLDAQKAVRDAVRDHYLKEIEKQQAVAKQLEEEQRELEQLEAERRQTGREKRPEKRAEAAKEREKAHQVTLANAEQISSSRQEKVSARDTHERELAEHEAAEKARAAAAPAVERIPDEVTDDHGYVSYRGRVFGGEEHYYGTAQNPDTKEWGVYRSTPDGIEYLGSGGIYEADPEEPFVAANERTAKTIAQIKSLRVNSDYDLEENGSTPERETERKLLRDTERQLIDGDITAEDARSFVGLPEEKIPLEHAKPTASQEIEAARSGALNGPLHGQSRAQFESEFRAQAEAADWTPEDIDAQIATFPLSWRMEAENNLHYVMRSGDWIAGKKGVTWILDSKGMLRPEDGSSAPIPLMKNGRYTSQAIDLSLSGRVGFGQRSWEEAKRDAEEQKKADEQLENLTENVAIELQTAIELSKQNAGLMLLPGDPAAEGFTPRRKPSFAPPPRQLDMFDPERETERSVQEGYAAVHAAERATTDAWINAMGDWMAENHESAWGIITRIAKNSGLTPQEVVRLQMERLAPEGTTEGKIANLKVGDQISDKVRLPWVVGKDSRGNMYLRSGESQRVPLDPFRPSDTVRRIVNSGEVLKAPGPRYTPEDIRRVAFEAPYVAKRAASVEEVKARAAGEVKDPEPVTPEQAKSQAAAAQERADDVKGAAIVESVKASDPLPGTSVEDAVAAVDQAEETKQTAEDAEWQNIEAKAKTYEDKPFPIRAPISMGERFTGNAGRVKHLGQELGIHYALVPMDGLVNSHVWDGNTLVINPEYDEALQPRTISESRSSELVLEAQLRESGNRGYDFDYYGDRTISPLTGPAIVEEGGRVAGGNTRIAIMRKHLELLRQIDDPEMRDIALMSFRTRMAQLARENGIPGMPQDGRDYVVVRVLDAPITTYRDAALKGLLLNASPSTQITEAAKGVALARQLTEGTLEDIGRMLDEHDTLGAAISANPQVFTDIVNNELQIAATEAPEWFVETPNGKVLSENGRRKFAQVLAGRVFQDNSVMESLQGTPAYTSIERAVINVIRMKATKNAPMVEKIVEAAHAARTTWNTGIAGEGIADRWEATYDPKAMSFDFAAYTPPPMPDKVVESIWRAIHAGPRTLSDRIKAYNETDRPSKGGMFDFEQQAANLETPAELFNRVFKKEISQVNYFREKSKENTITEAEYNAALENRGNLSEPEIIDAKRQDKGLPPIEEHRRPETAKMRKRIDQMSAEEAKEYIRQSRITGLPSREDFEDHNDPALGGTPAPFIAVSDMTGLKAFNETYGEAAGNKALRAMGDAVRKAGLEAYHIHGDEVAYRANSEEELREKLELARKILKATKIDVEKAGVAETFTGVDISYGLGKDYASADAAMTEAKKNRTTKRGEFGDIKALGGGFKINDEPEMDVDGRGDPVHIFRLRDKAGIERGDIELQIDEGRPQSFKVEGVMVDKELLGKGHGKALYRKAIEYAKSQGKFLRSGVTPTEDAARVWRSLGAEEYPKDVSSDVYRLTAGSKFAIGEGAPKGMATGKMEPPPRPRRNAIGSHSLEDALTPAAQEKLAGVFKQRTKGRDLRHIRAAMEVYHRLLNEGFPKEADQLRGAMENYLTGKGHPNAVDEMIDRGLQAITGEEDPDINNELLEQEVFASAQEAGKLIFDTLDPRTASFDLDEFNTAFGDVEFRREPEEVFPQPKETIDYIPEKAKSKLPVISQEEADKRIESWKETAKEIGKTEENKQKVVYSLYDESGIISKPWEEAGYTVRRFDIAHGQDLTDFGAWMEQVEEDIAEGYEVEGVIAQPPCTSFTLSGTRWWAKEHDVMDKEMVRKKYGDKAAEIFERPLDYANTLVATVKLFVGQADPKWYAVENPAYGRINTQNHLPKAVLGFDPHVYGDPYTKRTQLWGEFNPNLPIANVEPTEGSKIHKLRGDDPAQKKERSRTPEGFAYAFFMANHDQPVARPEREMPEPLAVMGRAKAEKGYVSPEDLRLFLESHHSTKENAPEIMRTARMMADYVYDLDPPEGVEKRDALGWVLRERLAGLEASEDNRKAGSFRTAKGEERFGKGILALHQAANPTTFLHEFAHVIFPLLSEEDMKAIDTLQGRTKSDGKPMFPKWDGKRGTLTGDVFTGVSEKFAGGLERFLRDQNPTGFKSEVKAVLQKIKAMFVNFYKTVVGDPLSDFAITNNTEAKRVYAEMFGITDFDAPDDFKKKREAARKEEARQKKGMVRPEEAKHPIQMIASEFGAKGIRKSIDGSVIENYGERVDPSKPTVTFFYPDIESVAGAAIKVGDPGASIQGADLIQAADGSYGLRINVKEKAPEHILYQEKMEQESPAFKRWFGDSKVVDENDKPLRVYHGTTGSFDVFDAGRSASASGHPTSDLGFFFSEDPAVASLFAGGVDDTQWPPKWQQKRGANTVPVFLSIKNPFELTADKWRSIVTNGGADGEPQFKENARKYIQKQRAMLEKQGYDGVHIKGDPKYRDSMTEEYGYDNWVAFKPEQIKSAIGNRGTYDPIDPHILFQDVPERHPGLELQDLEAKLAKTPESAPMLRKFLETRIGQLKSQIRSQYGVESPKIGVNPEVAKRAISEVKHGTSGKDATGRTSVSDLRGVPDGPSRVSEQKGTGRLSKPPVMGMPRHAGAPRAADRPGPRIPASLSTVNPVTLVPFERQRGESVGVLAGQPFDEKAWREGLKKAGLPENLPPPTVTLSPEVAQVLKFAGQKQIVQMTLSALEQGDGAIIASATGTGKTYTSGAIAKETLLKNPNAKILVITKNRGLLRSAAKIGKEAYGYDMQVDAPRGTLEKNVYGASYQRLLNNPIYKNSQWDLVIADESGEARNWYLDENQQGKLLMAVMENSKKGVYVSATPFHSPNEYGYLEKLNLWPKGKFQEWIKNNFAHEKIGDRIVARLDPAKQAKFREQLIERGQMVSQEISYHGFTVHFGVVPIDDVIERKLDRIHQGIAVARRELLAQGKKGLAERIAAFEATYTKAFLERSRLPQAIELAKKAREAGWHPLIFSETTSEDLFRRPLKDGEEMGTYRKLDEESGGIIGRIMPEFPNIMDELRAAFGDDIGDYSGLENTDAQREENKQNYIKGEKPMLYTSYAAGGIGVSLHDEDGDKPRFSIFLGPPYSGVLLEQAMGRTWRFGVKSNAMAVFLATDSEPDIRLMATKVGPRMRALRASVLGERDSLAAVMSNYTDEQKMREMQDLLAYDQGNEVKVDSQQFQVRSKRSVKFDNWASITVPSAEEAKYKGMQVEMVGGGKGDDWLTLYQEKPKRWEPPNRPLTIEDIRIRRAINAAADQAAKNPGIPHSEIAMTAPRAEFEAKNAPPEVDQEAAGRDAVVAHLKGIGYVQDSETGEWKSAETIEPGMPPRETERPYRGALGLVSSQEQNLIYMDRALKMPGIGRELVTRGRRYEAKIMRQTADLRTQFSQIMRDVGLNPHNDQTMRDIWDVVRNKRTVADPYINKAAMGVRKMMAEIHQKGAEGNLSVVTPDGRIIKWSDFSDDPSYMPAIADWDARFTDGENSYTLREIMGETFDEQKARQLIADKLRKDKSGEWDANTAYLAVKRARLRAPKQGNINFTNEVNFPFIKKNYWALDNYFKQFAKSMALESEFGSDLNKLNRLISQIPNRQARTDVEGMFGYMFTPQNWDRDLGKIYNAMATFESATKMTFSATKVLFHAFNAPLVLQGRTMPLTKALLRTIAHPKEVSRNAYYIGTVMDGVDPAVMYLPETKAQKFAFKATGFEYIYNLGRKIAGESARVYMDQYALKMLRKGGTQAAEARRTLNNSFLMGDAAIDKAVETGKWSDEDYKLGQVAFTNESLYSSNPMQMPGLARGRISGEGLRTREEYINMALRASYSLQSFGVKTYSMLREHLWDEVMIHHNLKPLAFAIIAAPAFGTALQAVGAGVKGFVHRGLEKGFNKPHSEDSWDKFIARFEALTGDHKAAAFAKLWLDGICSQWALERTKRFADAVFDLAMGDRKAVASYGRYGWQDDVEQALGPIWTDAFRPLRFSYEEWEAMGGKPENFWTRTKRNVLREVEETVPFTRNVPHIEEEIKKRPTGSIYAP